MEQGTIFVVAGLAVLAILFLMATFARLYRKAGPHEALVVYGFRGTRIIKGQGAVILPMVELCRGLSLGLMSFYVAPQPELYPERGVAVPVQAGPPRKPSRTRPSSAPRRCARPPSPRLRRIKSACLLKRCR